MKAVQINGYGGKEVVQVTADAAKPAPGKGQVLVEVHAAGVNPFDITVREGGAKQMAELDFPATLGGDFAGVIVGTGEAVYGQAGALSGHGSFAEYTPVRTSQLAPKPKGLDFAEAAALPLAATSAYQALVDHMGLQKGQKILIHGGAGGIGSLAIQLAKYLGTYVATTVSDRDADFVKGLGAGEVIDYKTQDFTKLVKDYDAVFDTVGGETNKKSYKVLKPGGKLVSMVVQPDEALVEKYRIDYTAQFTRSTTERLAAVARLVDEGLLKPQIDKVFQLDRAAEALEYLKTGRPRGKVLIRIR
ncbi:MAG TPA: NADP-dependent oxidoreductase [Candidatus Saccharimonadales bacterium]|nr:NADP-dependent oxidoreductase [Candidatus Saccharimonadales bacterium]